MIGEIMAAAESEQVKRRVTQGDVGKRFLFRSAQGIFQNRVKRVTDSGFTLLDGESLIDIHPGWYERWELEILEELE